jgi:GNAT superfamily N-acetyltransferase
MFERHFEFVSQDNPGSGKIALIPWDIETFGFGVADFQIDYSHKSQQNCHKIKTQIEKWAKDHDIELIGTTVAAGDNAKLAFVESLGFRYIDTTLSVTYKNVQTNRYPASKIELLPADKAALDTVVEICGNAFSNGRYHADKCFPKQLADRRYQDWVRRTLDEGNPQKLLTAAIDGQVCAFSVIQVDGKLGYLQLNAVAPKWQGQKIGYGLIVSSLFYLQKQAVDSVHSKISVSNIRALNLHASLGAKFDDAQVLLHWHAPWAKHLLK